MPLLSIGTAGREYHAWMLTIDGALGEGGGQILRSSLALSLITGAPFRLVRIRAGRRKPGLLHQHLAAVRAAEQIGAASVEGAALGSGELVFRPGSPRAGRYELKVGTAGSATLVAQTVLPALLRAGAPSELVLEGGTHNPQAPPYDFLERVFFPVLGKLGATVTGRLQRHGFYPAGGGRFEVQVQPAAHLAGLELLDRGALVGCRARAVLARLPRHIGERELRRVGQRLGWPAGDLEVCEVESAGPGNALLLEVRSAELTELFTGFGEKGVPAERVADGVAAEAARYLGSPAPVGPNLADQLLLYLAVGGGGTFRSLTPSSHARTNLEIIQRFLPVEARLEQLGDEDWRVEVRGREL
jgi:RNA 3'-terminal phosphate cyclase (ATP)